MLTTKIIDEKKSLATFSFCLVCQQPYTKSQSPRGFFYPSGLFDDWGNGARRLLTVEKEGASTSQAADIATTVADMFIELCCLQDYLLFQKFW